MTESPDAESRFLEQLGQRVRTMRALRGMSRKVLAKVSGISERYIAQLESGKGNVSIVLLRRVSDAMGAHLEDLLPSADPTPDWQMFRDLLRKATPAQIAQAKDLLAGGSASAPRRAPFCGIALIGLRGAGKSTLGKILAKKIGWSFVELNKEVEQQNGLSVAEIIALYGQEGFRRMEQAALQQLLARNELMVLATGGGIVSEPLTFDQVLTSFLHDLAEGRARGAHGSRPPPGRSAPDGGRSLRNGGAAQHPAQPRAAVFARDGGGGYGRAFGRCSCCTADRCGAASAAERGAQLRAAECGAVER
ncbi:transcriptional regulator with XRE-family HTH domain [Bradyrhizobium liaoningense]